MKKEKVIIQYIYLLAYLNQIQKLTQNPVILESFYPLYIYVVTALFGEREKNYLYDETNTKIRAITPDETISYVYDGTQLVYETSTKDGVKESVYAFKELQTVYIENEDKETYYYSDILGSTRFVTDDTGKSIQENIFSPFGKEVLNANRVGGAKYKYKYRYAGHESQNLNTGLTYMKARWMNPETGRFMSPDPAKQGINYYIYAGNNPTTMVDPTGLYHYEGSSMVSDPGDERDYNDLINDFMSSSSSSSSSSPQQQARDTIQDRMEAMREAWKESVQRWRDNMDDWFQEHHGYRPYESMKYLSDHGIDPNKYDNLTTDQKRGFTGYIAKEKAINNPISFGSDVYDKTVSMDMPFGHMPGQMQIPNPFTNPLAYIYPAFQALGKGYYDALPHVFSALGYMPGGDVFDALNVLIYLSRGQTTDAVLSAVAVIPLIGSLAGTSGKVGKFFAKYSDELTEIILKNPDDAMKGIEDFARSKLGGKTADKVIGILKATDEAFAGTKAGKSVIGPRDTYIDFAKSLGAKYLDLKGKPWTEYENMKYLYGVIERGDDVYFAGKFNPKKLEKGTVLYHEIEFLERYGYQWTDDFTRMIKVK